MSNIFHVCLDASIACSFDSQYICGYETIASNTSTFTWLRWRGRTVTSQRAYWTDVGPENDHTFGNMSGNAQYDVNRVSEDAMNTHKNSRWEIITTFCSTALNMVTVYQP